MKLTNDKLILFVGVLLIALVMGQFIQPALLAKDISYDSGGRRDPFVPLIGPDGVIIRSIDMSGFIIEGIIFDPKEESLALINGEFFRPGDLVRGATLKTIYRDHVVLEQEGEEITLWIQPKENEEGENII